VAGRSTRSLDVAKPVDTKTRNIVVTAVAVIGVSVLGLNFILGGFEKFEAPVNIVLPPNFSGVACGEIVADEDKTMTVHEVDSNGHFAISGDILRSHRPRHVSRRDAKSGQLIAVSGDVWSGVLTENGPNGGPSFAVFWVGSSDSWKQFAAAQGTAPFCLGRFK
jgi:hypothetical protein